MSRIAVFLLALASFFAAAAAPALAQAPKKGDWFEETAQYGFKIKSPKGWDLVPARPGDTGLIAKWGSGKQMVVDVQGGRVWPYDAWLVALDRSEAATTFAKENRFAKPSEDVAAWIETGIVEPSKGWSLIEESDLKVGKLVAKEQIFGRTMGAETEVCLYAATFPISDDVDIALIFNGLGGKKWSKHERAARTLAKSFSRIEIEAADPEAANMGIRATKQAELEAKLVGEWELYVTDNFFVVSANDDKKFLDELQARLEGIRAEYEKAFPYELAEEIRQKARAKANADGEKPDPKARRTMVLDDAQLRELGRTSTVRVCADRDQYKTYGGPEGSAGYWWPRDEELVVYDDKAVGGRGATWATLNHEAFHQYIYYYLGQNSPHDWYNEGHADFFAGLEFKNRKYRLRPRISRHGVIRTLIREEKHVPLEPFVNFTHAEYYGQNGYGRTQGECYAQGWSLVWFLKTGEGEVKDFDPAWSKITSRYLEKILETGDRDAANEYAFEGVDFEAMEAAWIEYTL